MARALYLDLRKRIAAALRMARQFVALRPVPAVLAFQVVEHLGVVEHVLASVIA